MYPLLLIHTVIINSLIQASENDIVDTRNGSIGVYLKQCSDVTKLIVEPLSAKDVLHLTQVNKYFYEKKHECYFGHFINHNIQNHAKYFSEIYPGSFPNNKISIKNLRNIEIFKVVINGILDFEKIEIYVKKYPNYFKNYPSLMSNNMKELTLRESTMLLGIIKYYERCEDFQGSLEKLIKQNEFESYEMFFEPREKKAR